MVNEKLLEDLKRFREKIVAEKTVTQEVILHDFYFDQEGNLFIDNFHTSPECKRSVLQYSGLMQKFPKIVFSEMDEEQSRSIFKGAFGALRGKKFFVTFNDRKDTITKIWYNRYYKPSIEPEQIVDSFIKVAELYESELVCNQLMYHNGTLDIGIQNKTHTFSPLETDSNLEVWTKGMELFYKDLDLRINHTFERLVCTNGCVVKHRQYTANISTQNFSADMIARKIGHYLQFENDFRRMIQEQVKKLKAVNASLAEYLRFRSILKREEREVPIADKYFPIEIYNRAYDTNILEKSAKWLSTADSGWNCYDLFNHVTYLGSHPEEHKDLTPEIRMQLQIESSSLLMKQELDLNNIAPRVQINLN
ncbi:MAG: hypothetical protein RML72_00560 [Bacteroidia bacterium]|nr:hypothetical protein [Bacteroidia bacterium]MDW8157357.1 hypothetical protein [Bacteroidia bacterium]